MRDPAAYKSRSYLANVDNLLHNTQLGGRKQRSAVDAALLLQHYVQEQRAKRKGNITSALFLDIKGTFDHVSKSKLLNTLRKLRLPSSLINWVESFVSERTIRLMFDGRVQNETPITIGIPQGSPISPILFLIYVRDIWQNRALQISYIDDFTVAVSSTSARKNCRTLESIANDLFQKATEKGAQFEPSKTELIHFHTRRKEESEGVVISGHEIKPKGLVRWLGIWFDSKLSFKQHVEKKINSATAAFFGLQRLGSLQKGLSFRALRQLYIACVTSIADFGAPLWYTGKRQGLILNRFQRLQNMASRHMLGAFKGSPTKALELETALPPPDIRFEKQCNAYALRTLRFQKTHPISVAFNDSTEDELGEQTREPARDTQLLALLYRVKKFAPDGWNIEKTQLEWEAPWATFPAKFVISTDTKEAETVAHNELLDKLGDSTRVFYTDGSKKDNSTSAAICRLRKGSKSNFDLAKHWNLGSGMEIADAEVFALAKALFYASQNPPSYLRSVYVFVDSQAAIARLRQHKGNKIIQGAVAAAEALKAHGVELCIQWCPSHMGIAGNEMADSLAKMGLKNSQISHESYVSHGHLKRLAKQEVSNMWRNAWLCQEQEEERGRRTVGMGRLYRQIARGALAFSLRPKPTVISWPKNLISAYIQLKTGKGLLKSFQHTIRKAPNNKCHCPAGQQQDTRHLLLECEEYRLERTVLKKQLKNIPMSLHVLFCTTRGHEALAGFLAATKICTVGWRNNAGL